MNPNSPGTIVGAGNISTEDKSDAAEDEEEEEEVNPLLVMAILAAASQPLCTSGEVEEVTDAGGMVDNEDADKLPPPSSQPDSPIVDVEAEVDESIAFNETTGAPSTLRRDTPSRPHDIEPFNCNGHALPARIRERLPTSGPTPDRMNAVPVRQSAPPIAFRLSNRNMTAAIIPPTSIVTQPSSRRRAASPLHRIRVVAPNRLLMCRQQRQQHSQKR